MSTAHLIFFGALGTIVIAWLISEGYNALLSAHQADKAEREALAHARDAHAAKLRAVTCEIPCLASAAKAEAEEVIQGLRLQRSTTILD